MKPTPILTGLVILGMLTAIVVTKIRHPERQIFQPWYDTGCK